MYARARRSVAGGVSSDARRAAGTPMFVDHASGAELWDVDGNRLIDYVLGQGPNILGHAAPAVVKAVSEQVARGVAYAAQHEWEAEVAERICAMVPGAELVRFNTVGSEAVHGALRLARGLTGRPKIVKFEGNYHGWLDPVLYSVHPDLALAGQASQPNAVPGSAASLTPHSAADLIVLPYNDLGLVRDCFERFSGQIAAVICEPLLCNTGAIMPVPGFLEGLRELCTAQGALLVFDEIITGFRLAAGGAQEFFGVTPDLATFGKAIAGGMPVSAIAGREEVMAAIADGRVAHAGTFNSQPVAMAAAAAVLSILDERREAVYPAMHQAGQALMAGIRAAGERHGVPVLVSGPGSVFQVYLTEKSDVRDYRDFAACDRPRMARLHELLLERGVNTVPRGLWFLSTAHSPAQVDETLGAVDAAFAAL
ncbi:aspartate aminotransferase family protein [Fodinicola feengrottensis]|uniref:aspartate aminotransferase family protein n=1 Tax=Fodinicola feengrottensis TaxID=435914 RepID=UPI0024413C1F|nr:glutamate-1-semialdehyde 2,1-aminomutase [Fodinicola feengrottensis]